MLLPVAFRPYLLVFDSTLALTVRRSSSVYRFNRLSLVVVFGKPARVAWRNESQADFTCS